MKVTILLLGLAALASASSISEEANFKWAQFKDIQGKSYENEEEEVYRRSIFEKNLADIVEHNEKFTKGLVTYSKAVNQFTDMDITEVIGGGLLAPNFTMEEVYIPGSQPQSSSRDWRSVSGVVTPVKNQGSCGSCWAFATTGTLEGQWALKKRRSVSLSEQQLVDCSRRYGNNGCHGGLMPNAYKYIHDAGGIESEASYPYRARDMTCYFDRRKAVATVSGYRNIPRGDEHSLTDAVDHVGPVAVAIMVTANFQSYHSGVFVDHTCNSQQLNHGVLVVGFGHDARSGLDYYIVKNSWGPNFGERGYIRMARNYHNMCGIVTLASYPVV